MGPPGVGAESSFKEALSSERSCGQTLKYQNRLADPDLVAVRQQSLLNRHIVHEGTIPAVKILDQESLAISSESRSAGATPASQEAKSGCDGSRPIDTSSSVSGKVLPSRGPLTASSRAGLGGTALVIGIVRHPTSIPTAYFVSLPNINVRSPNLIVRSPPDEVA